GMELRQPRGDLHQLPMQCLLVDANRFVGMVAHRVGGRIEGELRRLNDLEAMLVQDGERALDPFVGSPVRGLVVEPACVGEQERRQHEGSDEAEPQQSDSRLPVALHAWALGGGRSWRVQKRPPTAEGDTRRDWATPGRRRADWNRYNGIGGWTSQTGLARLPCRPPQPP